MSAVVTTPSPSTRPSDRSSEPAGPATRGFDPIPFRRVLGVELRKMFDTRAGFWLMAGIVISAVLATAAVVAFAPDDALEYGTFGAAIGIPMAVILPIVAILSVTSEWSQRTGLTTFTLVPHRGRVITAKAVASVLVGVVAIPLAFGVGALGNLLGSAMAGVDPVWDMGLVDFWQITLGNVIGLLMGFTLGVLFRSSAVAVVAYFVYGFVMPPLTELLAATQDWFRDVRGWVDPNFTQGQLFSDTALSSTQWANLGVTSLIWLVVPLAVGLGLVLRSEVK
ncbi:ABC transporter permease [Nocardioides sp. HDW12B]|uniref:ABC transporter permease n=1 Tax=Nocardioides sp. HDW12B TaxID=2714939 RepID=UPI0014086B6F|nr:ABC transporter permease [Nocardioides sp. HDW12B]QIK67042.1 ABC transporter permease [Nocardioides sp. HDW12B]